MLLDQRNLIVVLVCLLALALAGCPRSSQRESYADRLNLEWSAGTTWKRHVTLWPHRISHPDEAGDTSVERVWTYVVHRNARRANVGGRIEAQWNDHRYMMPFTEQYDVNTVKLIEAYSAPGVAKTTQVGRNSGWSGGGPFYPTSVDDEVTNLWFLPSLGGRERNEWARYPILAAQRSTGRWIEQKVTSIEGGLRFILRNRKRTEKVVFEWYRGEPWWSRAVWYRHQRVVGLGRRVAGGNRDER